MGYSRKIIISGDLIQVYDYKIPISNGYTSDRENYDKNKTGIKSQYSLNRARNNMIRTINANVCQYSKFITLTTKENITDREQFLKMFDSFRRNFRNNLKEALKYLGVLEQQKRGAWHIHLVVFNKKKLDFLTLKKCWTVGSVDLKKVDYNRNLGIYLAKYLTKENIQLNKKAVLKSRNLTKPFELTVRKTDLETTASLIKDLIPHYNKSWYIFNHEYYITKDVKDIKTEQLNECSFKEYYKK